MTQLLTERLILRTPIPKDIPALIDACSDPEISRYTAVPTPYSRAEAEYFVNELTTQLASDGLPILLFFTLDGALVGAIDLHSRTGSVAELGYWVHRDFRSKGYLTEAGRALLRYAFAELGLSHVHIKVNPTNVASVASARKLGFTLHAIIPGLVETKGRQHDAWFGSLAAADFASGYARLGLASYSQSPSNRSGEPSSLQSPGGKLGATPSAINEAEPMLRPISELVREFHQHFQLTIGTGAPNVAHPNMAMRLRLIAEEFCELVEAIRGSDAGAKMRVAFNEIDIGPTEARLIPTADALGDLLYVIYGMAILTNIPLDCVVAEIHRSNLTKLGTDGKPIRRDDGKVIKGPAYTPPNLAPLLQG